MSRFTTWANQMQGLPAAGLRSECDRALAREQSLGKINSRFAQAVRAVQGLLEGHLPNATALGTMDADTRQALLSLAESLANQGAISDSVVASARQAFALPQKAGKRFRQFVDRTKGLEPHQLRETLDLEITNLEATDDKGRYWNNLSTLKLMLSGQPIDLTCYRRKTRALFRAVADAQVAQGGLPADVLANISEADRKTETMLKNLKKLKSQK